MESAAYMQDYNLRGQHTPDRSMTRYRHDLSKMTENQEISTGPGRWVLGVPNVYGNAAFVPTPTMINQRWGASHNMESTKTDMESDLRTLGRPTVRTTCGQYQPGVGLAANAVLTPMPEVAFPQVASHLVDPPATLRGTGINRWEWLDTNPQERVLIPFEHRVDTQMASKDQVFDPVYKTGTGFGGAYSGGPGSMSVLPAPRPPRKGEPASFNDRIPGSSQRPSEMPPIERSTPQGYATLTAGPYAPPMTWSADQNGERLRGVSGILSPPPPFSTMIAQH